MTNTKLRNLDFPFIHCSTVNATARTTHFSEGDGMSPPESFQPSIWSREVMNLELFSDIKGLSWSRGLETGNILTVELLNHSTSDSRLPNLYFSVEEEHCPQTLPSSLSSSSWCFGSASFDSDGLACFASRWSLCSSTYAGHAPWSPPFWSPTTADYAITSRDSQKKP